MIGLLVVLLAVVVVSRSSSEMTLLLPIGGTAGVVLAICDAPHSTLAWPPASMLTSLFSESSRTVLVPGPRLKTLLPVPP